MLNLKIIQQTTAPEGIFVQEDIYVRKQWRQMQYLAEVSWKRKSKEYLASLQQRQKWLTPEKNVQQGDVVLIVDSQAPRRSWPMGRVIETYPDKNGLVRSVKVQTKTAVLVRPIVKLCLLLEQEDQCRERETN